MSIKDTHKIHFMGAIVLYIVLYILYMSGQPSSILISIDIEPTSVSNGMLKTWSL